MGKGGDHPVMTLVVLQPADRRDRRRPIGLTVAVAGGGEGEVGAVGNQHELLGGDAELAAVLLDLEAGDRDQSRRPLQQRPQQRPLQAADAVARLRGVAAAVEGDDVGDAERQSARSIASGATNVW